MINLELNAFPASLVFVLVLRDSFLTSKFFVCNFKLSGRLAIGGREQNHAIYSRNVN